MYNNKKCDKIRFLCCGRSRSNRGPVALCTLGLSNTSAGGACYDLLKKLAEVKGKGKVDHA